MQLLMCPADRATVLVVGDDTTFEEDSRVIPTRNDSDVRVPRGYRLLCAVPQALSLATYGCELSDKDQIYSCISGSDAADVCIYGTAAVDIPSASMPHSLNTSYCIHADPCKRGEVLYYDTVSRKSLCLTRDQSVHTI